MDKQINVHAVESILYGIYKATHNTMGDSSASLLRKAAPDIFNMIEQFSEELSETDSLEHIEMKLSQTFKKIGLCDKIILSQQNELLKMEIINNAFSQLTTRMKNEGIPAFGCPFAAITIVIAERFLKKKARLKSFEPTTDGEGNMHVVVQLS